jgi:hypothetical protein
VTDGLLEVGLLGNNVLLGVLVDTEVRLLLTGRIWDTQLVGRHALIG